MRPVIGWLFGCLLVHSAQAQTFSSAPTFPSGSAFNGSFAGSVLDSDRVFINRVSPANGNVGQTVEIPLGSFASAGQIQALNARIDALPAGGPGPAGPQGPAGGLSADALIAIAARIDRLNDRFSEGIALAGSFNVLPPNYGDRFAVSIGGAGYNGAGAASISASARIDENTIVYGGIARGPTQTMVKGGLGWSFR